MRVTLSHTTRLDYSNEVVEGVMDARLGPHSDAHQRWLRYELRVGPTGTVRRYRDGFGNAAHLITVVRPHRYVEVTAEGEVDTLLRDPFQPLLAPLVPLSPGERADYLRASSLVPRHAELDRLAAPYRAAIAHPDAQFDAIGALMHRVYTDFTYQKNVTNVATTVPEVLVGRTGVCQDFAHVLIGLCRSLGVPARYVSGYIVLSGEYQAQSGHGGGGYGYQSQSQSQWQGGGPGTVHADAPSRGAGASHAWVEAYTPTHGWRGFDPTNDLLASEHHVKIAIGRDYGDVSPTRGAFRGVADESLSVAVVTRAID